MFFPVPDLLRPTAYAIDLTQMLVIIFALTAIIFLRVVYLLHFHPLAKFPGPRAAALSRRWLYGISVKGYPEEDIARLHERYGSHAVRIAPNELHLSDTRLYKTIYTSNHRYLKNPDFYKTFPSPSSLFTTEDPAVHKMLRRRFAPYMSQNSVAKAQPTIIASLQDLARKVEARGYEHPVNMYKWCRCFPADVIVKLVFGQSDIIANCDDDLNTPLLEAFDASTTTSWLRAYHPTIRLLQDLVPIGIGATFSKNLQKIKKFADLSAREVKNYRSLKSVDKTDTPAIATLEDLPEWQIRSNASTLIAGGSDTTGYTLAFATWSLLQNPALVSRLITELDAIFDAAAPEEPSLAALQAAPVLSAVISESLRCGLAVSGRLPRVVPSDANLVVDGQLVPAGTIIGMSAYTMHMSEDIWGSDVASFNPERWITGTANASDLVIFSKGVRNCIGQSLATAELYVATAFLFRRYEMRIVGGPSHWTPSDRFTSEAEPYWVKMKPRNIDLPLTKEQLQ